MTFHTLNPVFSANYNPEMAEEGSFVHLDTSTFTDYPSSGFGKYAQLVYVVGGDERNRGPLTDHSGTIAASGVSQQVCGANINRNFLFIQNVSDTDMWCNFDISAVTDQPSIRLIGGDSITFDSFVPTGPVFIIGATGKAYTVKEG